MTIEGPELARRLKLAREAAGLTQEAVAAALGISRPAVGLIEKNRRTVSGIELDRLAALYRIDLDKLLGTNGASGVARFRKDNLADMPGVAAALEDCLRVGRDLARLEDLTGVRVGTLGVVAYELPQARTVRQSIAQGTQTAEAERRRLGIGDEPVADLVALIDANGVRTATIDMPNGVSGIMVIDAEAGTLIAVNKQDHVLRRRFSLAHEYGHALLDRVGGAMVTRVEAREDPREIRANSFASAFLMPEVGVRRRLEELGKSATAPLADLSEGKTKSARDLEAPALRLHDVAVVAHAFGVSRLAMLNRLRSLRLIAPKQFEALRDDDAKAGAAVARLLALDEPDHFAERLRFDRRYIRLALDAHLAGHIGHDELMRHLVANIGLKRADAISALNAFMSTDATAAPSRSQRARGRSEESGPV